MGGSSDKIEYFKFKEPVKGLEGSVTYIMSTVAFDDGLTKGIVPYGAFGSGFYYHTILGFAFCDYVVNTGAEYEKITSFKEYLIKLLESDSNGEPIPNDILDNIYEHFGIIPIAEEEYYNLIQ